MSLTNEVEMKLYSSQCELNSTTAGVLEKRKREGVTKREERRKKGRKKMQDIT